MSENNGIAVHIFRGTLKNTLEESYPMHNAFSAGGAGSAMEIARSLGDLSHNAYTSASGVNPTEVLLLDYWADPTGMLKFFSDTNVQEAGARLCSSYDETAWLPAPGAFTLHLPAITGKPARYVAMVRAPVRSAEDAIAEFARFVSKNVGAGRRRGQSSHGLFIRLAAPTEPLEILGIDFWSTLEGLREHYGDAAAWHGFGNSLAGLQTDSVWEQASGFVEW